MADTRNCCDCGRDLAEAMGVYVFAPDGRGGVRLLPGLLRCVDCHTRPAQRARHDATDSTHRETPA